MLATAIEDQNAFSPTLCFFPLIDGQTRVIRLQVIESPNARDQVALDNYIKSHRPKKKIMLTRRLMKFKKRSVPSHFFTVHLQYKGSRSNKEYYVV